MKALVLTYDKQVGFAELVVKSYLSLWKQCPFQFIIPRNNEKARDFNFLATQANVSIVPAPASIRETMSVLLDSLHDDEWVYWCIDDRYPIQLDARRMQKILDFIASGAADNLNGIKLIHWRESAAEGREDIRVADQTFRFQTPASMWGFWHHHFLRAKVLKHIFLSSSSNGVPDRPAPLNDYFHKLPSIGVFENIVFPFGEPIVQFGETLMEGYMLANACEALARHNCPVPPYRKDPRSVLFKTTSSWETVAAVKRQPNPEAHPQSALQNALRRVHTWIRGQTC